MDEDSFSLPNHAGLSSQQSADKIAEHFSGIAQQYAQLDVNRLPLFVQNLIKEAEQTISRGDYSSLPIIYEHEVWNKMKRTKLPKSAENGGLPPTILRNFYQN